MHISLPLIPDYLFADQSLTLSSHIWPLPCYIDSSAPTGIKLTSPTSNVLSNTSIGRHWRLGWQVRRVEIIRRLVLELFVGHKLDADCRENSYVCHGTSYIRKSNRVSMSCTYMDEVKVLSLSKFTQCTISS